MVLINADELMEWCNNHYDFEVYTVGYISDLIKDIPTVDAVPVIRCKDCKWWEYYDEGDFGITYGGCRSPQWFHTTSNGLETTGDDFCSWAERKEE